MAVMGVYTMYLILNVAVTLMYNMSPESLSWKEVSYMSPVFMILTVAVTLSVVYNMSPDYLILTVA